MNVFNAKWKAIALQIKNATTRTFVYNVLRILELANLHKFVVRPSYAPMFAILVAMHAQHQPENVFLIALAQQLEFVSNAFWMLIALKISIIARITNVFVINATFILILFLAYRILNVSLLETVSEPNKKMKFAKESNQKDAWNNLDVSRHLEAAIN